MRRLVFAALLASSVLAVGAAAADEKQVCLASSERGQRLKNDGKLAEARKEFLTCSRDVCPAVVRSDCNSWLDQVTALMPTVVVGARDDKGNDVTDCQVFLDGQKIADRLDGKALTVPTGEHVLRLEREGSASLEQKVLIREGEKARPIDFKLGSSSGSSGSSGGSSGGSKDIPPPQTGGHTLPPWIVFGVGAAAAATGVILYFVERGQVPPQCDFGSRTCVSGTPDDVKQQASSATANANVGLVIAVSGAVIAVGGLVWHFVEPTGPSQPATATLPTFKNVGLRNVTPVVGPNYTGAGFSAAF